MKICIKNIIFLTAIGILLINQAVAQKKSNDKTNFDSDWRFHLGGMQGAEEASMDDSKWRQVDLPHDWSIEDRPGTKSPFSPSAISQVSEGFTMQGTGWYRKTFEVSLADKDKQVILQFDGVYMNADVYVNGHHLGNHPYGFTSFYYNITQQLKFGEKNVIAVEVKNEGQNSRWYSGSGIYRHVWLKTLAPVHVTQWGTYVTTPEVSASAALINITNELINDGNKETAISVITKLISPHGNEAGRTESKLMIAAGEKKELKTNTLIKNPQLWSCESPALYQAITEVYQDGNLINSEENAFGVRKISFDATKGFQLNGKMVKLKGGCFHNDNGPLGAKAYDRAEERKVELLKASGFNAIRCSHNPPSPAFLDACDRLGMLVIDEAFDMWNYGKNPYDYHLYFKDWWQRDIESMITRDRNHPSIIMWSIGNEIPEKASDLGEQTAQKLAKYVKAFDETRPVTAAVNDLSDNKDAFFSTLDVCGYNYAIGGDHHKTDLYEHDHQRKPKRIMMATESYPMESFGSWMAVEDHPYVIGDFVWTAWDYIGEASIGWRGYPQNGNFYPWNLAYCGDIDICGWKRPQSYYRDALWKPHQLSIFVKPTKPSFEENPDRQSWSRWNWFDAVADWSWKGYENTPFEVSAYSSCEEAELFLNGKSLGKKKTNRSTEFKAIWNVPYQPGELKVIGYSGGKQVNSAVLRTALEPVQIKLVADRKEIKADGEDLCYITAELTDEKGIMNPKAQNLVKFEIEGPGEIIGVGNANPLSTESYTTSERKAWRGKCLVIIKSTGGEGKIILRSNSEGLQQSIIQIITKK